MTDFLSGPARFRSSVLIGTSLDFSATVLKDCQPMHNGVVELAGFASDDVTPLEKGAERSGVHVCAGTGRFRAANFEG